jgi:hypothetical protein
MNLSGELVTVEVRPTRKDRVILEKFHPGAILSMLSPAVSFFYRVTVNGEMKACTPDPLRAREVFRESCRWACKA